MLLVMRLDRRQTLTAVFAATLCIGAGIPWSVATASEFYSWIGPSGEMVLTDDAGKIPPAGSRGPVSVHRFQEPTWSPSQVVVAAGPNTQAERIASGAAEVDMPGQPATWHPDSFEAVDPAVLELSDDVLLEQPDQPVASHYGWVPLSAPVYVGSAPLYGFWSRRTVESPAIALQQHLLLLQATMQGSGALTANQLTRRGYRYPRYAGQSSLQPASRSTSVGRHHSRGERQALLSSLRMQGSPSAHAPLTYMTAPSPSCCGQRSSPVNSRRGGSRR